MTGEDRTLSITGRFRNLMGSEIDRARRELAAYIDEARLGAVPFRELSKAAREFVKGAEVPRVDINAALGMTQATAQARDGYDASDPQGVDRLELLRSLLTAVAELDEPAVVIGG